MDIDKLWDKYLETRSLLLRNRIIEHNLPLVISVVKYMYKSILYGYEFDDLVSYGVFGLIKAVELFDPSRGCKFCTYATPKIRGSILDEIRKDDWVPRSVRTKIKKAKEKINMLQHVCGEDIDPYYEAKESGLTPREYNIMKNNHVIAFTETLEQMIGDPR